jgi:hypothetical protein
MFLRSVVGLIAAKPGLVDVFLLGLLFDPEDETSTFLQNVSGFISGYKVLVPEEVLHHSGQISSSL